MGMTITEKILAAHVGRDQVRPGEFLMLGPDLILANDITAPIAICEFNEIDRAEVFDRDKVIFVPDHFTPNKDVQAAQQSKLLREFVKEKKLTYYWEVGRGGIEHVILPDEGLVLPGQVIIGADSHTCTYGALGAFSTGVGSTDVAFAMAVGEIWLRVPPTQKFIFSGKLNPWVGGKDLILFVLGQIGVDGALYKAMEFGGEALKNLSQDDRFTVTNMAIEGGAKNGIIEPDEVTLEYLRSRTDREFEVLKSDADATYEKIMAIDVSGIDPQVALPHLPSNVKPVSEIGQVHLDQVVIGSCTNGRMEDLRTTAKILKGRETDPEVRLIIIPGSQEIFEKSLEEGLIETFIKAKAVVSPPTCGPCLGGHMGVLAAGEKCLATTNRNFRGRMGDPGSEVYLSGPAVAAASAVVGRIVGPEELF